MADIAGITARYEALKPILDERTRRLVAAAESQAIGKGGISFVSKATGISRPVIRQGIAELKDPASLAPGRIRREGGGRKKAVDKDASLKADLEHLLESTTRGDPEEPLRWTCKSVRQLTAELKRMKHRVSHQVVADLLHAGLQPAGQPQDQRRSQSPRPQRPVRAPEREGEMVFGAAPAGHLRGHQKEGTGGRLQEQRAGMASPRPASRRAGPRLHDPELGRANPYGVYDLAHNRGWVSVGIDHDTAAFAVRPSAAGGGMGTSSIRPPDLLITADAGGSNGSRNRLWKRELQALADETGLEIEVAHFPPGTSKWNKIEHRLFSFISQNWRGKPLRSFQTIVSLIAATSTSTGLKVHAELNTESYLAGLKVSDQELAQIKIRRDKFHGDWNYEIQPRNLLPDHVISRQILTFATTVRPAAGSRRRCGSPTRRIAKESIRPDICGTAGASCKPMATRGSTNSTRQAASWRQRVGRMSGVSSTICVRRIDRRSRKRCWNASGKLLRD